MKKRWIAVLLVAVLAVGVVACGGEAKKNKPAFPGTPDKETVTIDIMGEPAEINHILLSESVGETIIRHFMSGLTRLDEKDAPIPDIAESWETNEEHTLYTMHLRKDAVWTNGDPVTAHDFYFSWVTQMTPETGAVNASSLYEKIKNGQAFYNGEVTEEQLGIKVIDDYTLEIEWEQPNSTAPFLLASPVFYPMNQKAYEEIGAAQYAKDVDKIVSNGPFQITEWVHDDHILMEKSKEYWNADSIGLPKVKLVMINDDNARLNAFKAGEVDLCSLYSEQIDEVKKVSESAIESYIDGGTWYLDFNMKNQYVANENLRKALSYSVDVQGLLDTVIKDGSVAADGLVPSVIGGADGKTYAEGRGSLFAYDPEAAKGYFEKALEELGMKAEDIKIQLLVNDSSYGQTQAAYIQQQWKEKLEFDVELRVLTWKARVEAQIAGDYDVLIASWGSTENSALTFLDTYESGQPNNMCGYSNAEYDQLIKKASVESDPVKQQELLIAAEKMLIDANIIGPLYFTCTTYAVSDKLEGAVRTPFQYFNVYSSASIQTEK